MTAFYTVAVVCNGCGVSVERKSTGSGQPPSGPSVRGELREQHGWHTIQTGGTKDYCPQCWRDYPHKNMKAAT